LKDFDMSKFTYTDFDSSIAFARSNKGAIYLDEQYVGKTANKEHEGTFSVYRTPEAAALGALADCREDELDWIGNAFSVTAIRCDGILLYGADIGHNDGMTHTDHEGFVDFLKNNDWLDSDWITDIYDLEVDVASCKPWSLKFNQYEPWTLEEARAIAADGDEALCSPSVYYQNARPQVVELDDGEAMVIIFNNGAPVEYGVLNAEDLEALREDVRNLQLADIDYSLKLYDALERCYYISLAAK
jgi:PHD/YefM family antitoxin component YafN of YafNO toxin-antitoxin module